jgi:16S rRNA (guanine527-N7)-methyltransferase
VRGLPQLLKPYLQGSLQAAQLSQIELYLNLLLKWNAKMNLTAVRDAEEIVRRHFGESLFAGEQLGVTDSHSLIDIGSGAGFPGLPIKILAPHIQVTLIESQQKKVAFLREVIRALDLKNTSVFARRAEDSHVNARIVTMRAVEKFESALKLAAGLVEPEGRLTLLIGAAQIDSARRQLPLFTWRDALAIPESRNRVLLIGLRSR